MIQVRLGGVEVAGSPFPVRVWPGQPYPPKCKAWWGQFSRKASGGSSSGVGVGVGIGGGSEAVDAASGETLAFTVSLYDRWGNKYVDSELLERERAREIERDRDRGREREREGDLDGGASASAGGRGGSFDGGSVSGGSIVGGGGPVVVAELRGTGDAQKCLAMPTAVAKPRPYAGGENGTAHTHVVTVALGPLQQAGAYAVHVRWAHRQPPTAYHLPIHVYYSPYRKLRC